MTAREFIMQLPSKVNPEALTDKETTFHFKISGEGGGDFTANVKNGQFEVKEGLEGDAKCVVTTADSILMEIIKGERNPQMAVFTGKLKISNLGEMMKYAKVFGLM
jgi:putative sterol carrier protein